MKSYSPYFLSVVHEIDLLMSSFSHKKKDIGYGYRWTFKNTHRFDCIDYSGHTWQKTIILRFGRGYLLTRKYPILTVLFDEILKVVAKMYISDIQTLHSKNIVWLFEIINDLKPWKYNEIAE